MQASLVPLNILESTGTIYLLTLLHTDTSVLHLTCSFSQSQLPFYNWYKLLRILLQLGIQCVYY